MNSWFLYSYIGITFLAAEKPQQGQNEEEEIIIQRSTVDQNE
jgi:hypothetical protein